MYKIVFWSERNGPPLHAEPVLSESYRISVMVAETLSQKYPKVVVYDKNGVKVWEYDNLF